MRAVRIGAPRPPHSRNEAADATLRQIGGCGRCTGARAERGQAQLVVLALVDQRRSVHARVISSSASSMRSRAVVAAQAVADELVLVVDGAAAHADVEAAALRGCRAAPAGWPAASDGAAPAGSRRSRCGCAWCARPARWRTGWVAVDALAGEVVLGEPDAVEARRPRPAACSSCSSMRRASSSGEGECASVSQPNCMPIPFAMSCIGSLPAGSSQPARRDARPRLLATRRGHCTAG